MAKNSNLALWKFVIGAVVILSAALASYFLTKAKADYNEQAIKGTFKAIASVKEEAKADIDELEEDGCKPALKNTSSIGLIEYRLDEMQVTQQAIEADTKEILKRLPK